MLQMCFEVWQPLILRILLRVSTSILLVRYIAIESSLLNGSQNTSYLFSYVYFDKSGTIVRRAGLSTLARLNPTIPSCAKLYPGVETVYEILILINRLD